MRRSRPLILVALLSLVAMEAKLRGVAVAPFLTGIWLVIGIGHGLFDAFLAARVWRTSVTQATLLYAMGVVAAAALGFLIPAAALLLHALVSAYHFGQAEWGEPGGLRRLRRAGVFLWGASLVVVMVLGPWYEAKEVLRFLLGSSSEYFLPGIERIRLSALVVAAILGLASAAALASEPSDTEQSGRLGRVLETALLQGLFVTMPLWVAFPIYLSLWHGLRSLSDDVLPVVRSTIKRSRVALSRRTGNLFSAARNSLASRSRSVLLA